MSKRKGINCGCGIYVDTIQDGIEALEEKIKLVCCKECSKELISFDSIQYTKSTFYKKHFGRKWEAVFVTIRSFPYCAACRGMKYHGTPSYCGAVPIIGRYKRNHRFRADKETAEEQGGQESS